GWSLFNRIIGKGEFMAEIATFEFPDSDSQDKASEKISVECGSGGHQGFSYGLVIFDDCSNPSKAMDICRIFGGQPK
ncbi:MAG: hypothetical protein KC478_15910, partial [Bacteriovoracaceae bacterium]|nr:hypothetical protein [Bacteriovoracaceae bacterium]